MFADTCVTHHPGCSGAEMSVADKLDVRMDPDAGADEFKDSARLVLECRRFKSGDGFLELANEAG